MESFRVKKNSQSRNTSATQCAPLSKTLKGSDKLPHKETLIENEEPNLEEPSSESDALR